MVSESSEASRNQTSHRAPREKTGRESMRRGRRLRPCNARILYAYSGERISKMRVSDKAAKSALPKRARDHTVAAERETNMSNHIPEQDEQLTRFLGSFQNKLRCILGAKLIGIYIHGSLSRGSTPMSQNAIIRTFGMNMSARRVGRIGMMNRAGMRISQAISLT